MINVIVKVKMVEIIDMLCIQKDRDISMLAEHKVGRSPGPDGMLARIRMGGTVGVFNHYFPMHFGYNGYRDTLDQEVEGSRGSCQRRITGKRIRNGMWKIMFLQQCGWNLEFTFCRCGGGRFHFGLREGIGQMYGGQHLYGFRETAVYGNSLLLWWSASMNIMDQMVASCLITIL